MAKTINISANEIHLWFVYDAKLSDPELLAAYHGLLAEAERQRLDRFMYAQPRHQYLISRALLRSTLSLYDNTVEPAHWAFRLNDYGKPAIRNRITVPLKFNVSHTEGMIVLAIALSREVGVDVESMLRRGRTIEIAEHFFSPQETYELKALPISQQRERFFRLWTLKEAYIKACGKGLSMPLHQFSFHFPQEDKIVVEFDPRSEDHPGNWAFWHILPNQTHKVSLALAKNKEQGLAYSLVFRESVPMRQFKGVAFPYFPAL